MSVSDSNFDVECTKIIGIPSNAWVIVQVLDKYALLFGRLIIKGKKERYSQAIF